jgi:putative addiction module component (TIGR02574 family)
MNTVKELLEEAIKLKPVDRALLIEGLVNSIDEPDKKIDEIWLGEAEARLKSHRAGKSGGVPFKDFFGEDI